jgi:dTDP-glucose 4,6-dehydratase
MYVRIIEKLKKIEDKHYYFSPRMVGKDNFEVKIARCFAFIGPYLPLNSHLAIANFIKAGFQGTVIDIQGDGKTCRSYLYMADLTIWLWTILFKGENCYPYNVGSDKVITIAELANFVSKIFEDRRKLQRIS